MEPLQKPSALHILTRNFESMRRHVDKQAPKEACGLLAGKIEPGRYRASIVIPATNILQSATHYRIDPPWYQYPPFDLVAECLVPTTIKDERVIPEFQLQPRQAPPIGEIVERALQARDLTMSDDDD